MKFSVLGSGSRGNAVYIESGGTGILIDNGFSGKEVEKRLMGVGRSLENVSAVCVTHEHNDHIGGVGVVSRRCRIPVYANSGTFLGAGSKLGKLHKRVDFDTGDELEIKDLQVRSFPVSHDTADPVGYVISDGTRYLGYCTDTGKVTRLMELRLARCHGLILEFNHNLELLKNGPYPLPLQQRVRSAHGHLCNEHAADFLHTLLHPRLKYGVLAHLSETNNTPELALQAAEHGFDRQLETELILAVQDRPTPLLALT